MRPNYQRGQVYPLFAIMLTVLIGVSALSVDMGYYRYQQRAQQAATDSAAIAGGQASFYQSANSGNALAAARNDATQNGYTNGSNGVTVNTDPDYTDAGNCSTGCVRVTIVKSYPAFFGSIFKGFGHSKKIATYAAAKLQSVAGACLTSLGSNPTSSTSNGAKIDGPDCGIADKDCTTVNGGTNVTIGSWSVNGACGNSNSWNGGSSQFTPSLPPVDPCSVLPACQTLANAKASDLGLTSLTNPACSSGGITVPKNYSGPLSGGCYSGQKIGGANSTIQLAAGLYVFVGTNTFNGNITGNGVTFYFAKGAHYADQTNLNMTITAPDNTTFSAFSTGEGGVLMYQTLVTGGAWGSNIQGTINWTGLTYMPNWDVTFNGHSEQITGNFTTDSFTVNGGSSLVLNPGTGTITGNPDQVVLAE